MHSSTTLGLPAAEAAPPPPKTLVESAYRNLRRNIIEGRLTPGEKLRIEHMKEDYGVGGATLREALSLLISDALVVSQGQRGFRVAPVSLEDLADITETRVMLEGEALRQSITRGDDAWEASLMAAFHRLTRAEEKLAEGENREEWEERNRVFHEVLISACPSRWVKHFVTILYNQAERYRHLSLRQPTLSRDVHGEHRALFEAALERDADKACQVLAQHIRSTLDSVRMLPADAVGH